MGQLFAGSHLVSHLFILFVAGTNSCLERCSVLIVTMWGIITTIFIHYKKRTEEEEPVYKNKHTRQQQQQRFVLFLGTIITICCIFPFWHLVKKERASLCKSWLLFTAIVFGLFFARAGLIQTSGF
mmetsp:Transcript_4154/g.6271  ORF Transcript_4154/g.6271 Transcript_4154/m.6271 type:complete len:126 (-) Transcript_4154:170-547(-)